GVTEKVDGPVPRRIQPVADILNLLSPRRIDEPVPRGASDVDQPLPAIREPALDVLDLLGPSGVGQPLPGCPGNVDDPLPDFPEGIPDGLDVVVPGVGRRRADAKPVCLPSLPEKCDGTDGNGGIDDDRRKDQIQQPPECTQQS